MKINFNKGFGRIEALVGITIAALLLTTFTTLIWQTIKINTANTKDLKATMYLQELIEIAKDLEQSKWNEFDSDGDYYPDIIIGSINCGIGIDRCWKLFGSPIDPVTSEPFDPIMLTEDENYKARWLTIEGDPADSSHKKKVTATIKWNNGFQNKEMELETYVYNYNP